MEVGKAIIIVIRAAKKQIEKINKMEYGVAAHYYTEKVELKKLIEILEFCGLGD